MEEYWEKGNHSWSTDSSRFINTPSPKSKEMFYYIQEIGHFKAHKPYYAERENLPSFLMKYTLSGKGTLFYNNKKHLLEKGDVFFIDCMSYQHYYTESDEPWEMDWIHFQGPNVTAFYNEYLRNGSNLFHSPNLRIPNLISRLLALTKSKNARTEYSVSLLIHELLNELVLQKNNLIFEAEDIPEYVLDVQVLLDEQFNKKISLDQLEKQFLINKFQLNKEFSKYIGVPPNEYVINNRINFAKNLLRYSNMTISEISYETGIDNIPYFCRLFKNRTGMTPTEFRVNG